MINPKDQLNRRALKRAYENGAKIRDLAVENKVSKSKIYKELTTAKTKMRQRGLAPKLTPDQDVQIAAFYPRIPIPDLAKHYNVSRETIRKSLHASNVEMLQVGGDRRAKSGPSIKHAAYMRASRIVQIMSPDNIDLRHHHRKFQQFTI